MRNFIQAIANTRFVALIRKEFSQIRRDRRVIISLIVPPILDDPALRLRAEPDGSELAARCS